jgi:hypothetical protein
MYKQIVSGLVVALLASFVCGADKAVEATKDAPMPAKEAEESTYGGLEDVVMPARDSTEYWIVRSQAVNDLTSFLTQKRADLKEKFAYFTAYIDQIGKAEDMLSSSIEGTDDPAVRAMALGITEELESKKITLPKKPLSWEELVEFSMKYILSEGYSPIYIVDEEEMESFKNILKRKEQFCLKVREETLGIVDKTIKAWLYLGTIEKQKEFRLYMLDQKKQKAQVREEKRREILDKQGEAARQRREMQKDAIAQEKQSRLQNRYYQNGYYY